MSETSPIMGDALYSKPADCIEDMGDPHTEDVDGMELYSVAHSHRESQELDPDYELPYRGHLRSIHRKRRNFAHKNSEEGRRNFLASVKNRNLTTVKQNLQKNPALTTLITQQGVSALETAVKSGSVDMIKLFLDQAGIIHKAEVIEHAILYAIKENSYQILKYLLQEREEFWDPIPKKSPSVNSDEIKIVVEDTDKKGTAKMKVKTKTWNQHKEVLPGFEDAEFAVYITPIILAAKLERQEMISLLLEYEASEIHPLTADCPFLEGRCEICEEKKVFKWKRNLEESKRLLEVYRALSSPAYIFLCGVKDPILEAFYISKEMSQMKQEDPSFTYEYDEIAKKCRRLATELLDLCRTTTEVEILLQNGHGVKEVNLAGHKTEFPRVLVSLHYNQTEFIAHPYTQQVLQKNWYEGLPDWFSVSEFHYLKWILYWLLWIPCWPIGCVLFMLKIPWFVKLMKKPINKFVTDTLSSIAFITQIILISTIMHPTDMQKQENFEILEFIFIFWLCGMTARQIKMMLRHRQVCKGCVCLSCDSFTNRNIRWFDMVIFLLFWMWVICRIAGFTAVSGKEKTDRNQWDTFHPILISEAFFAPATILCLLRLTSLLKSSSSLGPLQISLKNMILDIVRFMVIFAFVMTGFVIATVCVYSNYEGNKRVIGGHDEKAQPDNYIGIHNTYKTYFWDIFGYGEVEYGDIVVNYTDPGHHNSTVPKHKFTEVVGYLVISAYFVVAVVVLLNMLIAMMANSYNAIAANADREWKFARTRLWMAYYSEVGALPPPFNVVLLGQITKWIVKLCAKKLNIGCCQALNNAFRPKKQKDEDYDKLIENLKKRYWSKRGVEERRQFLISKDQLDGLLADFRVTDTTQQKLNASNV